MDVETQARIAEYEPLALAVFVSAFRAIRKRPPEDPEYRDAVRFLLDDSSCFHRLLNWDRSFLEAQLERILEAKEEKEAEVIS